LQITENLAKPVHAEVAIDIPQSVLYELQNMIGVKAQLSFVTVIQRRKTKLCKYEQQNLPP